MTDHTRPIVDDNRVELLISMIASGEAENGHWDEFATIADQRTRLWRDLALAIRDQSELSQVMSAAVALADTVELPDAADGSAGRPVVVNTTRSWSRSAGWAGWAIAAIVAVMALVRFAGLEQPRSQDITPVAAEPRSAEEAFDQFLDLGRAEGLVVSEVPARRLLDVRPAPDGHGVEALYMRQVLETRRFPNLFEVQGYDESGKASLARYEVPVVR